MNKHKFQQGILKRLFKAAEQDQWILCTENIEILLYDVNEIDAINIVVKRVRQFLSDFSRTYPDDEAIRNSIEAFNHIESLEALSQQGQLIDPLLHKYWNSAGVSSVRNSFKGITKPEQYFEHSGKFVDTVVSILLGIFMAIEGNNYWGDSPEYSNAMSLPFSGLKVRIDLLMLRKQQSSLKSVAMRKLLWTELARDLEMVLQSD